MTKPAVKKVLNFGFVGGCLVILLVVMPRALMFLNRSIGSGEEIQRIPLENITPALPEPDQPAEVTLEQTVILEDPWNQIELGFHNLAVEATQVETSLRIARAKRWQAFATYEVSKSGSRYRSSREYLLQQLKVHEENLVEIMSQSRDGDQLIMVEAKAAAEFRRSLAVYLDIAEALSLKTDMAPAQTFVETASIQQAMISFSNSVFNYEGIARAAAQQAYSSPQNTNLLSNPND